MLHLAGDQQQTLHKGSDTFQRHLCTCQRTNCTQLVDAMTYLLSADKSRMNAIHCLHVHHERADKQV